MDEPDQAARLGQRVRAAREACGFTQEHLGWLTAMTQGQISALEVGRRVPRFFSMIQVAQALGQSAAWLTQDELETREEGG